MDVLILRLPLPLFMSAFLFLARSGFFAAINELDMSVYCCIENKGNSERSMLFSMLAFAATQRHRAQSSCTRIALPRNMRLEPKTSDPLGMSTCTRVLLGWLANSDSSKMVMRGRLRSLTVKRRKLLERGLTLASMRYAVMPSQKGRPDGGGLELNVCRSARCCLRHHC